MSLASPSFCDRCGAANRVQARFCRVCGQLLQAFQTSIPATTISSTLTGLLAPQHMLKQRYMILSQIGRGGFGAVYKAMDTQFGHRIVAVKEMSQNNLSPQELIEATTSFQREAMLLANLTHPNLPRIYEQFTDTGRSYLVMDFIEGTTLEDHLKHLHGKKMPIEQVLNVALQLCAVLDYLHTRQPPIIFRDLKPANVMLTPGGHVYLIDFGIARHFKPGQTKDTTALGSSGYAAPEQYGKSQTTARADIYSLGATLHQLITGNDPSETPFQFAPIQLPNQPTLSGLDTLIMSMVSVDINKRPASIAVVRQELQRITTLHAAGNTNPQAHSTIVVPNVYQPPQMPNLPQKPRRARQTAQSRIAPQANTLYICFGHTSRITTVAWSPDGKLLASASYDKTVRIWEAAKGNHVLTYKEHRGHVNDLAWSPDSKYIASAGDDGSVHIWEARTGQQIIAPYHGHRGPIHAVTWSPDNIHIASAGDDKIVYVWNRHTGVTVFQYREHKDTILTVAWSPDGKHLASAGKDRLVQVWEPLRDQQRRSRSLLNTLTSLLSPHSWQKALPGQYGRINSVAWSPDSASLAGACGDGHTLVWDAINSRHTTSLGRGGSGIKNAVAWSPRGKYLAVASNDKTVQVWNTASKNASPTFTYYGHTSYVMGVAWSPDGSRIASAGVDRTLQVWQAA